MAHGVLEADVLVVGGGLAGSTLAHALALTPLTTVLVEARDPSQLEQPSFDGRATALANGSQRILASLGLWEEVAADAQPIRSIHVSECGRFGAARIHAEEEGVAALGYTLENRILGSALWRALDAADGFTCLAPAKLSSLAVGADRVEADVTTAQERLSIVAKVVVAADGTNSQVRRELAIATHEDPYEQQALILNCATEIPHAGRAFERLTPDGRGVPSRTSGGGWLSVGPDHPHRFPGRVPVGAPAKRGGHRFACGADRQRGRQPSSRRGAGLQSRVARRGVAGGDFHRTPRWADRR